LKGSLYRAYSFSNYFLRATRKKNSRSEFVRKFLDQVLVNGSDPDFSHVNKFRQQLLDESATYYKKDFGTGSSRKTQVNKEARSSSISIKYGELLGRIMGFQSPENVLELGTCFGLSTLYIQSGAPQARITSLEGCPGTFEEREKLYKATFDDDPNNGATYLQTGFDKYLQGKIDRFNTIFIDGNHTHNATMRYFERFWWHLPYNGLLIFDDIHWSYGMNKAWNKIKDQPDMVSVDLYQFGLCFKRKGSRRSYILRY